MNQLRVEHKSGVSVLAYYIGAAVVRSDVLVRDCVCVHGVLCVECVVFEGCGDSRNLGTAVR